MKFNLHRPCAKCPFRNDIPPYLTPDRVLELQAAIESAGKVFTCHQTLDPEQRDDETGDYLGGQKDAHCAGALILLEKAFDSDSGGHGCRVNQMARIAVRLGVFDPSKLDLDAPVYGSFEEMYDATVASEEEN
jgi:hypothetical protein